MTTSETSSTADVPASPAPATLGGAETPAAFVHNLRLPTGEDFPILCWADGRQIRLPARYAFHLRQQSVAESTLHKAMLRLGELYSLWAKKYGESLDERLTDGPFPRASAVEELLRDGSLPGVEGRLRNERVTEWGSFLTWAADPRKWRYVGQDDAFTSASQRAERITEAADIVSTLREQKVQVGGGNRANEELRPDELEAIEAVLLKAAKAEARSRRGRAPETTADAVALTIATRDWLLYATQHYLGLRLGEALKIREEDVPARESPAMRAVRSQLGKHLKLGVRRRASDPDDPRRRGAVKRFDRRLLVAEELADQFWQYRDLLPAEVRERVPYVFVSARCRPLSVSRAEEVGKRIALEAAHWFEAKYPERTHSLTDFRWHRLRHTRAHYVVGKFFRDDKSTPDRLKRFLDYFGWKTERSAWPYIASLESEAAEAILQEDNARLLRSAANADDYPEGDDAQ